MRIALKAALVALGMLSKITDGRTDLVFDFVNAGHPATTTDARGVSLIKWCAYYGDVSAIKLLLANGETLASLGENFDLNGAAFHGHWRLCQFLIEQGADVNHAMPVTAETPLHAALCKPNMPTFDLVVELLIAHGANPNSVTNKSAATGSFMRDCRTKGETPLHRAAAFGSEVAIQLLIDAGAAVDAKDMNGDSPLSWASWHHRPPHVLAKLCYGDHQIHPDTVQESITVRGIEWRGMEKILSGKPHLQ